MKICANLRHDSNRDLREKRKGKRNLISKKLAAESKLVRKESLIVLNEFESLYGEDKKI